MRSRMAPQDEGAVFLMLTIFLYLPSCVHSSPKRGRFRSGLWRGGEAAPAPVEYRSAVPGGLLKAAWRSGLTPRRKRLSRLCAGQKQTLCGVSLPALDYAGAASESALRRDGEGRSPMDPLRVTGSVGRGVNPSGFAGGGFSSAPADRGNPASRTGWNTCPRDEENSAHRDGATSPGERRGNLPPWDRWGNSPDAGRTLRAGEQDGSAQNRRARSAGSSPIAY